jgi:hypothetical protein
VSYVKYELDFYIPEDDILQSHRHCPNNQDIPNEWGFAVIKSNICLRRAEVNASSARGSSSRLRHEEAAKKMAGAS